MKKMIIVTMLFLAGCKENTIHIKHYNADHGGEIEILDANGAMIASKEVGNCGFRTADSRAHSSTTEFEIDNDHEIAEHFAIFLNDIFGQPTQYKLIQSHLT